MFNEDTDRGAALGKLKLSKGSCSSHKLDASSGTSFLNEFCFQGLRTEQFDFGRRRVAVIRHRVIWYPAFVMEEAELLFDTENKALLARQHGLNPDRKWTGISFRAVGHEALQQQD
jgi:hypothetical protein